MTDRQSTQNDQSGGAEIARILSALQASPDQTIVRIGQAGGVNEGSTVAAVMGGQTTLTEGTKYIEAAQIGGTVKGDGKVAATKDHALVTSSAAAEERCEPSGRSQGVESKTDQLTFGKGNTVALLLSGAGTSSDIFRKDVEMMETFLIDKIGLSKSQFLSVHPNPDVTTKTVTGKATDVLKGVLKDPAECNFIFYYSGHFNKDHTFQVDSRNDRSQDYYTDTDLAGLLRTVPAKYVLLILDMCYSGRADVGAKDGGEVSEAEGDGDEDESAEVPLLWKLMTSGNGLQAKGDPQMVVQWSSSLANEKSYHPENGSSFFTQAIVDVVNTLDTNEEVRNELERGQTHASVLQLHRHVVNRVDAALKKYKKVQRPIIKPDHADAEYFKRFPALARVK
ncbi:uncharacterized protein [Haliotis asinina]|uniref:uncharacterized protein n=1 Tax=Haliotis asinina TaxID=109174 RepID=UPI003531BBC8